MLTEEKKSWNSWADGFSSTETMDKYRRGRGLLRDNCPAIKTTWRRETNKITRKFMVIIRDTPRDVK